MSSSRIAALFYRFRVVARFPSNCESEIFSLGAFGEDLETLASFRMWATVTFFSSRMGTKSRVVSRFQHYGVCVNLLPVLYIFVRTAIDSL